MPPAILAVVQVSQRQLLISCNHTHLEQISPCIYSWHMFCEVTIQWRLSVATAMPLHKFTNNTSVAHAGGITAAHSINPRPGDLSATFELVEDRGVGQNDPYVRPKIRGIKIYGTNVGLLPMGTFKSICVLFVQIVATRGNQMPNFAMLGFFSGYFHQLLAGSP